MRAALVSLVLLSCAPALAGGLKQDRRAAPARELGADARAVVGRAAPARPALQAMRQTIEAAGFADAARTFEAAARPTVLDARTPWLPAHGAVLDSWSAARADPQSNTILYETTGGPFVTFRATPGTIYVVTYYATGSGVLTGRVGSDSVQCHFASGATACMVALRAAAGQTSLSTWAYGSAMWSLSRVEISPAP